MIIRLIALLFLGSSMFSLSGQEEGSKDTVRLFFLGGQSNMEGYGYNSQLPDSLNKVFDGVYIYHGNSEGDNGSAAGGAGVWSVLRAGHGAGFKASQTKNYYSDRFGAELSFASTIQRHYPKEKIAIVKYTRGGTSLDSTASTFGTWDPEVVGTNQYDYFLSTLTHAFGDKDIDNDGIEDVLVPQAIIWMQGESDSEKGNKIAAKEYLRNLKRLMILQRAALRNKKLPVVVGRVSNPVIEKGGGGAYKYVKLVRQAQEQFTKEDEHSAIVRSTDDYLYSDPWHYNSKGYIDLGSKFAEAVIEMLNRK